MHNKFMTDADVVYFLFSTAFGLYLYVSLSIVAGLIATTKNREGTLIFLGSLMLTPIPFLFYVLGATPKRKRVRN